MENADVIRVETQTEIEKIFDEIKNFPMKISEMEEIRKHYHDRSYRSARLNPDMDEKALKKVYKLICEFDDALCQSIAEIAIKKRYSLYCDIELDEIVDAAYAGLFDVLRKGNNKNQVRIDTWLSKNNFYYTLSAYIEKNQMKDSSRKEIVKNMREEPLMYEDDSGQEFCKADSQVSVRSRVKDDPAEIYFEKEEEIERRALVKFNVEMILSRYQKKPIAAYYYLLKKYCDIHDIKLSTQDVCRELSAEGLEFHRLWVNLLSKYENAFGFDLSAWKILSPKTEIKVKNYLNAFRKRDAQSQRNQLDRLFSLTNIEIKEMTI